MSDYKPSIGQLHVTVKRVVRIADYESFTLGEEIEAAPDPNFSTRQNLENLRLLLTQHVDQACNELVASLRLADSRR